MRILGKSYSARQFTICLLQVILITALFCIVDNVSNLVEIALFTATSTLFVYSLNLMLGLNRKAYIEKALQNEFIDFIYELVYYKAKGRSQFRALEKASSRITSQRLKEIARESAARYTLDGKLIENFLEFAELKDYKPLAKAKATGNLKEIIRNHNFYVGSKQTEIEESAQRYATLNMFLSTILPSFLVFGFIGNAVLSGANFNMLIFSFAFLVIIPALYSFGNLVMWRRLNV